MFYRLIAVGALAMGLAALDAPAHARERLVTMATQTVNLADGSATIEVGGAKGAYRGIRLEAKDGTPIEITAFRIVYADDSFYGHDNAFRLEPGERTRTIDPKRKDVFVDRVGLSFRPGTGSIELVVLGVQSDAGARLTRPESEVAARAPAAAVAAATPTGATAEAGEVLLAGASTDVAAERATIAVGRELGKLERIRLRVADQALRVEQIDVTFDDGGGQAFPVGTDLSSKNRSPWLDLPGGRFVKSLDVTLKPAKRASGRARLEVTGQQAASWLDASGDGRAENGGWVLLGSETAGFAGFDRDKIAVGTNAGGFARIRIAALDRAVTLREVRVNFADGTTETFEANDAIEPGTPFGPLEFKAAHASPVTFVEARYRSRFGVAKGLSHVLDATPAIVQIWAQH